MQDFAWISGAIGLAIVVAVVLIRKRVGRLNAASWLVIFGVIVVLTEHPQFAIADALPVVADRHPHARIHLAMTVVYELIGLVLFVVIVRTLLRDGRKVGWYAVLFALIAGGGSDLVLGAFWFQHGSPIYRLIGLEGMGGWGWQMLYLYIVAWTAPLAISYRPIFTRKPD